MQCSIGSRNQSTASGMVVDVLKALARHEVMRCDDEVAECRTDRRDGSIEDAGQRSWRAALVDWLEATRRVGAGIAERQAVSVGWSWPR